jgi:hypothetical protein
MSVLQDRDFAWELGTWILVIELRESDWAAVVLTSLVNSSLSKYSSISNNALTSNFRTRTLLLKK